MYRDIPPLDMGQLQLLYDELCERVPGHVPTMCLSIMAIPHTAVLASGMAEGVGIGIYKHLDGGDFVRAMAEALKKDIDLQRLIFASVALVLADPRNQNLFIEFTRLIMDFRRQR